jgi:hypothetical protein
MTRVEVLTFEDCPNAAPTIALVRELVAAELPGATVDIVDVGRDAAASLGFLGSPSVRVDGVDVDPSARDEVEPRYGCRVYRTDGGIVGVPPAEWIRDALRCASAQQL